LEKIAMDNYGPIECGDRNGLRYLVGFTDEATNYKFVHPMQHKSQAIEGLELFAKHIDATARFAEAALKYTPGVVKFGTLSSDRDGAFTTCFGSTRSKFDERAAQLCAARRFATPGTPESGSVAQERTWRVLKEATDASMLSSGMLSRYKFDAALMATHVGNRLESEGNLLGGGEPPLKTLGIEGHLEKTVPFGNPCVVKFDSVEKGVIASRAGRIIGIPVDTPGYRVLLDPLAGADKDAPDEIITSIHVTPRRAGKPWGPSHDGSFKELPSRPPDVAPEDYVPLPTWEEMQALSAAPAGDPEVTRIPVVQAVGAAPGDGGSRAALRHGDEASPIDVGVCHEGRRPLGTGTTPVREF